MTESDWVGEWRAVEIGSGAVLDEPSSTLAIAAGGAVHGSTCLNRFAGEAEIDGQAIRFGQLAVTRRAGPPPVMEQETRYLDALNRSRQGQSEPDGGLLLLDDTGQALVRFVPSAPTEG